jgi:indolepyruvate ferredoxin oxidoreductase alpha subunit
MAVDQDMCVGCRVCIGEIGCPALSFSGEKVQIDAAQCTGCSLCSQLCPTGAIKGGGQDA